MGSRFCPECGEDPTEELPPSPWERLRYWLVNGSKAPTTLVCTNGHQWVRSVGWAVLSGGSRSPRWVRLPRELFRAVLSERRMHPTPMTYLLATGAGLLLGLLLDLAFGWPWWVVASGFVVLVWLFFLSSAFRGPDNDLRHRLLTIIDPDRAAAIHRSRLEDALASGSLACYEVEHWEGVKSVAGWSGSPDPDSLTIRHGEYDEQGAWVEVTTHSGVAVGTSGHWIHEDLERRLVEAQFPLPSEPTMDDFRQRQRDIQGAEQPHWQSKSFRIDNERQTGRIARAGSQWAAILPAKSVLIDMIGNEVDPEGVRLVRLTNLDSYPLDSA